MGTFQLCIAVSLTVRLVPTVEKEKFRVDVNFKVKNETILSLMTFTICFF